MMKVFIEDDDGQTHKLPEISLKDGFLPTIHGDDEEDELSLPSMEPALWCKVLVLDKVVICCSDKSVTWSITAGEKDSIVPHVHNFREDCSGYDDEDELFEMARDMISKKSFKDSHMAILRMLHCSVLPRISFDKNDIKNIEQARQQQARNAHRVTNKLEAKCFDVADCQEKLDSMQEHFLPDLNTIIDNGQCSKQFLELLLCDLVELEWRVREKISTAESRYVELVPTQPSALKRTSVELLEARQERDFLDKKLVSILTAREIIIDRKDGLPSELETQPCPIVDRYMDKRCLLHALKDDKNKLTQQQCCALMVREMLDTILADLYEHGFTQGDYADAQGARPTDVLQGGLQPEWQTLRERVATILCNDKHPIAISFTKFCSDINNICTEPFTNGINEIFKYSQSTFYVSLKPTEILTDSDYVSVDLKTVIDPYNEKLYQVKEKILHHMEKMANRLSEYFNSTETHFQEKLRLAYETCFYEKEHKGILWLYEKVHAEMIQEISHDVQRIKDRFPIDLMSTPVNLILDILFETNLKSNGFMSSSETNGCSSLSTYDTSTVDKGSNSMSFSSSKHFGLSERNGFLGLRYDSYVNIPDNAIAMETQSAHYDNMSNVVTMTAQAYHYDGLQDNEVTMVTQATHFENMPKVENTTATQSYLSSCEDVVHSTSTSEGYCSSDGMTSVEDIAQQTSTYTRDTTTKSKRACPSKDTSITKARKYLISIVKDCCQSNSLKSDDIGSLVSLIDEWDTKVRPISESLERSFSMDVNESHKSSCADHEIICVLPLDEPSSNNGITMSGEREGQPSISTEPMFSKRIDKDMHFHNISLLNEQKQATSSNNENSLTASTNDHGIKERLPTIDQASSPTIINVKSTMDDKKYEHPLPVNCTKRTSDKNGSNSVAGCNYLSETISNRNSTCIQNTSTQYETFEVFGPALSHIKSIFNATNPLAKLKHLTISIDIMSKAADLQRNSFLRNRKRLTRLTQDDWLPLLVLLILQLKPIEMASLCMHLIMLEDFMPPCLYEGAYGQTLDHFQKAIRVIEDLWLGISQRQVDFTVNGIPMSKAVL